MRRTAGVVVGLLVAGTVVVGVAVGVPFVRRAIAMDRHARQAALREPAAEREWNKEFGDTDRRLSGFPKHGNSQGALRLTELARSVEIDMARPVAGHTAPGESDARKALSRTIRDYGTAELIRPGGRIGSPPEGVRLYLEAHTRDLESIIDLMSKGEPLEWESDPSLGWEAPIPNLLGELRLQQLLVAHALDRAGRDDEPEADRSLRASWALNASLRDRPEVISQVIALNVARMQLGAARRVPVDPAPWLKRFSEHDYRASFLRAMEVSSIGSLRHLLGGSGIRSRASRADFLDLRRVLLVRLRDTPVADGPSLEPLNSKSEAMSDGEIVARISQSDWAEFIRRVNRLVVDTELTERILRARLLKSSLGHWPVEIPDFEASRIPGGGWSYSLGADGRVVISFRRELHWQDQSGLLLASRYESR